MNTLQASEKIDAFLTECGFNKNGNDYWKTFPVTDLENDWNEEVYVSHTLNGFNVWYPEKSKKDKIFRRTADLINYIKANHLNR